MKYLSLFSGIEAATVAFESLGWEPIAFSEIGPFACAVLKHRFPDVPNWGDVTKFEEWPDVSIDLICGGSPCQSFSIAGLRKGLDDARGNLMLTFGHILGKYRPAWFIWENVPGVLSSESGRDFASFLGLVTGQVIEPPEDGWRNSGAISGIDSAYGVAYRVLDAQYTRSPNYPRAVPQRRRRVFVVGHLGDWRRAAAVLLDSESLSRNPAPRRETGQKVAPTVTGGPPFSRTGNERIEAEAMVVAHTLSADGFDASEDGTGRGVPIVVSGHKERPGIIAIGTGHAGANGHGFADEVAHGLDATGQQQAVAVAHQMAVRRLLPVECERLQGFADNWTNVKYRGRDTSPDGPRYKSIGNSMATPCMEVIGIRIEAVEHSSRAGEA